MPVSACHDVCVCVADIHGMIIDGDCRGRGLRYMGMSRGRAGRRKGGKMVQMEKE